MLERFAAWLLNNYLGRYLENLNTDQLSIALLQGEAELENVPLRHSVLETLGLPVRVHAGFVGKVRLKIPLRKLRSEPWVISFEQVYLVAGPRKLNEPYNEEAEEAALQEHKMAVLDAMENEWRSENDPQLQMSSYYSLSYSSWLGYGASLVTNILENFLFKVKDVHIRYEDDYSCPESVFACGIRIDSLTAQSCDDNWIPKFMSGSGLGMMYKLVELDRLAVYWDVNAEMFSKLPLAELAVKMMHPCSLSRHSFLLSPVSGHAHVKRNCSQKALRSLNAPRVACDLLLDRVTLELRDVQYSQLVQCCRSLEFITRANQYRKFRPEVPVTGNAREYWLFAGKSIMEENRQRIQGRNWETAYERVRDIIFYVSVYKEHLCNPAGLSAESKLRRDRIENEFHLEDLQALRRIAMRQLDKPHESKPRTETSTSNQTVLQRWFSSYWPYSSAESPSDAQQNEAKLEHELLETLEDAMRDSNVTQRDLIPLHLTFTLKQGLFRLSRNKPSGDSSTWKPLLELEFENVVQQFESRPKLKSQKFHISLGNLLVRDCWTQDTLFPFLVAPQRKETPRQMKLGSSLMSGFSLPFFRRGGSQNISPSNNQNQEAVFELLYEKKPPGTDCNHRLKITSLALECVYNYKILQSLVDFFSVPHASTGQRSQFGQRLREAARSRFEAVKEQTRKEFNKELQRRSKRHSWDVHIDISAPHILVPESVVSRDALLVIVDFGHLHITRSGEAAPIPADGVDEGEEYQTPCSTPPNEMASDDGGDTASISEPLNSKAAEDVSDRYNVQLSDLQVLVCRVKDNWKHAHLKGTSSLHFLDRFSILVLVDFLRSNSSSRDQPSLMLSGSLPNLIAHINEPKMQAFLTIWDQLQLKPAAASQPEEAEDQFMEEEADVVHADARAQWFFAQFNIEQLSVEVQSRGRSVAELQVTGVQTSYSKRSGESSFKLAVHSLLLVDAMQTLGPDYELLVASHKHLFVDSMSGSLRESEPTSPVSPASPDPTGGRATSPLTLARALTTLQVEGAFKKDPVSPRSSATSPRIESHFNGVLKSEALITIEVITIEPSSWSGEETEERMHVVNVDFNSLDVIANQDTIVELASFLERIVPIRRESPGQVNQSASVPATPGRRLISRQARSTSVEMTFDFHRLTVLLLRSVPKEDGSFIGRKVATFTVTEARIHASLAAEVVVQGSLGGLQVLDLTPEGQKYQRIISVGHDPLVEHNRSLYMLLSQGLYDSVQEKRNCKAFSFHFLQPSLSSLKESSIFPVYSSLEELSDRNSKLSLDIQMASLCYTHSAQFLVEVVACLSEFRQSVLNLAHSLRSTAAEMAVDLMHRGTEGLAQSIYVNSHLSSSVNESLREGSFRKSTDEEDAEQVRRFDTPDQRSLPSRVRFHAVMESPILVLPRSSRSPEVLVAHLGEITISNEEHLVSRLSTQPLSEELAGGTRQEHFDIEVRDMSLFSLNVEENWKTYFGHLGHGPSPYLRVTVEELYNCSMHGRPILHDTLLRFSMGRITGRPVASNGDFFPFSLNDPVDPRLDLCDVFELNASVVSPLKMSLSGQQYRQILDSLEGLTWPKMESKPGEAAFSRRRTFSESIESRNLLRIDSRKRNLVVKASFELPAFSMELLDNQDLAILELSFQDLVVSYETLSSSTATMQVSLRSLLLEDLSVPKGNKNRFLVTSHSGKESEGSPKPLLRTPLSSSCPDVRTKEFQIPAYNSLPDRLEPTQQFWKRPTPSGRTVKKSTTGKREVPGTPPGSPVLRTENEDNLVSIKMLFVDPKCPDFIGKYNSTQRFVDVDFNSLDIIVNLESWVMALNFFGVSQKKVPENKVGLVSPGYQDWRAAAKMINSQWEVQVRSFSVILNKPEHQLAQASISDLTWEMASRGGNIDVQGKLGSIAVLDLTPVGREFRERFITSGNEALDFQFFRFSADDPHLARDYDMRLNLNMASVMYVHTQRFYVECLNFLQKFQRLQQNAAQQQAPLPSSDRNFWRHGSRLLLNVDAGSPVVLLPACSASDQLLIADLGRIKISNSFLINKGANAENSQKSASKTQLKRRLSSSRNPVVRTQSSEASQVLVDVIQVELSHMDLCTGKRLGRSRDNTQVGDLILGTYVVRRESRSLLREKCEMKLEVRRNLDSHISRPIPDLDVRGALSTVECCINESQYKLIRALLSFNLGEQLDFLQVGDPTLDPTLESELSVWQPLSLRIDLVNVVLEVTKDSIGSLATVHFIQSRFLYESFSDQTKDVDLVSQQVVIRDTRTNFPNDRLNVFPRILEPVNQTNREGILQAEVHYRAKRDFARFTVVLNNMRLLAIFDWWSIVREFLIQSPDEYKVALPTSEEAVPSGFKWTSTSVKPSPIVVSTGVVSKRTAILETNSVPLEFKINISDSEVVLVEDPSIKDSFAVILKGTAVVAYRPQVVSKPLSCHLNQVEIFSSILSQEEDTALSIVDPATITIEIVGKSDPADSQGILDATSNEILRTLEIQAQLLSLRLSYNDMRLFQRILSSLPNQARADPQPVERLRSMGFKEEDCLKALDNCDQDLDEAAIWLTQNANEMQQVEPIKTVDFSAVEIRMGCISLCVIDDCRDADVPLLEVSASQLLLRQKTLVRQGDYENSASCLFSVEYYNRVLSGWEPFLEPFHCSLKWNFYPLENSRGKRFVQFSSDDVVNVNLTEALVELYRTVKSNWIEDLYGMQRRESKANLPAVKNSQSSNLLFRRRSPFVPFALHNATGSKVKFCTLTSSLGRIKDATPSSSGTATAFRWLVADVGETVPFSFEQRGKMRHRDTHDLQIHQLVIEVKGWSAVTPVSVDRVGIFFRYVEAESSVGQGLKRILLVVAVTLEGSARKLVTVRSAVQVTNSLEETVELKLEQPLNQSHPSKHVRVPPCTTYPVPVTHLLAQIWVRPLAEKLPHCYSFAQRPIEWHNPAESTDQTRQCYPVTSNRDPPYRFCVNVRRENFPLDPYDSLPQPGHTITLLSPLQLVNLLPCELFWEIKSLSHSGIIKPGKETSVHTVDVAESLSITFRAENFVHGSDLLLEPPYSNFTARLRLYDTNNRLLILQAKVVCRPGGALKLSILASYWLVNKSGLPLVFRQEGVQQEVAGQFDEHEMARSVVPLLFAFTDREASPTLTARIGNGLHPDSKPNWCQHFALQKGVRVRSFRVSPRDGRPDLVYLIGVNIRPGRGRYRDTQIVTFAPCYQLYNQSSWNIQVSQRCFATTFTDPGAQSTYLNLVSGCHLPFHWPRLDKDQLLCVRLLDLPGCHWSGGFTIRNIDSFHINVRDTEGQSNFLRVEIVQQECSYCVVFSDASTMPPPFRIHNLSEVPIVFHQADVQEAYLHSTVRPHDSLPYALDEPTKPAQITCIAPGGAAATYDMTQLKEGSQLTYENFIYICLTATFSSEGMGLGSEDMEELVLDVPEGTRVVLNRKETGRRSQLWRMTGSGMLQHEGSSPPRDPAHPHADPSRTLVLDIAGPGLQPSEYVHLMLRKPDPRRQLTQTWRFTEDGRLCCGHSNVYVQAKDGFYGVRKGNATHSTWRLWNDVVLGPPQPVTFLRLANGIPAEQAIQRQRLRPGSGCLAVKVLMDGPTRVLQISDMMQRIASRSEERELEANLSDARSSYAIEARLKGGLGLSIANHVPPEELVYCRLTNICFQLTTGGPSVTLDISVQSIQVDNPFVEAQCPVLLYLTTPGKQDQTKHLPALHLTVHRSSNESFNADIYKHLIITSRNLTVNIEEKQLFKLLAFAGFNQSDLELERMDESEYETQRSINAATSMHVKRYYFGTLKLVLDQVRLSVFTSGKLSNDLQAIKQKLGLTLIKFEDANIELDPFAKMHSFETAQLLVDSIVKHYKDELKSQAAKILGSTDFLGNPLGFVNDVTEGVSGFLSEGNVGVLVQNVTYGLSNSAAKVTGSLSEGLGRVTMDERHEEIRRRILKQHSGQSADHLVAGIKGLGFGILGGMTSIFSQTYEGIATEGVTGFFTGIGKGLVGTVTKPAVGVLDLATGAASAVRDSSRSSTKEVPKVIRPPRLIAGPGGLLPRYVESQGQGQKLLYELNQQDYDEKFIAYEALGGGHDSLHMLISSQQVRVFTFNAQGKEVVLEVPLESLQSTQAVVTKDASENRRFCVEIVLYADSDNRMATRRPQIRCDSETLARKVAQEIMYAKSVYEENRQTLSVGQALVNQD